MIPPRPSWAGARAAAAHLLLLGFGLASGAALGEFLLRILPIPDLRTVAAFESPPWQVWSDPQWGNPPGSAYRAHATVGYEHNPLVDIAIPAAEHPGGAFRFRTNNLGLRRDLDTSPAKLPGVVRVLVLGDSHTDGYVDNDESFATLLESQLSARLAHRRGVEVLNGGVVGYSPAQELLWYRLRGAALAPDVVVVVFYAGNDVVELEDPSKPGVNPSDGGALPAPGRRRPEDSPGPGRFARDTEVEGSRVMALARFAVRAGPLAPMWQRLSLPGRVTEIGGDRMDVLIEILRTCHGCYWQSVQQAAYARRQPQAAQRALRRTVDILVWLDRDVRASGRRLIVAMLPTRSQVEPSRSCPEQVRVAQLLGLKPGDLAFEDEVASTVLGRLQSAGVATVPLLEALRGAAVDAPQYYSRDWHLNVSGHQTVAAALARAVREGVSLGLGER